MEKIRNAAHWENRGDLDSDILDRDEREAQKLVFRMRRQTFLSRVGSVIYARYVISK